MPNIIPIRDLKNTGAISQMCHESGEPVFVTKNGYGNMVVLSMEAYEKMHFESEVYFKLREAEQEAEYTDKRFSSEDVLKAMREAIGGS